jgi:AbiV family abortive infection protein
MMTEKRLTRLDGSCAGTANLFENWFAEVNSAVSAGQPGFASAEEFDLACDHVVRLLKDAVLLFESASHASAAFLAITAIEEIAKAHIGSFRRSIEPIKRSKDPLFRHAAKHSLAIGPTVAMGDRLREAIGEDRMQALLHAAHAGEFARIREAALYVSNTHGKLQSPAHAIPTDLARELILLAIEAFDDGLVGSTKRSMVLGPSGTFV